MDPAHDRGRDQQSGPGDEHGFRRIAPEHGGDEQRHRHFDHELALRLHEQPADDLGAELGLRGGIERTAPVGAERAQHQLKPGRFAVLTAVQGKRDVAERHANGRPLAGAGVERGSGEA
jgi:hypothetical protein